MSPIRNPFAIRGRLPAPLLRLALGELARAMTDDQNVLPRKALDAGFIFTHPAWRSWLDTVFA
jgi:NAD dependent epimerase/dehydratase family enzyme